jgi:hypothetical protein
VGPKGQAHGTKVAGCIPEIAGEGKINSRTEVNIAVQVTGICGVSYYYRKSGLVIHVTGLLCIFKVMLL